MRSRHSSSLYASFTKERKEGKIGEDRTLVLCRATRTACTSKVTERYGNERGQAPKPDRTRWTHARGLMGADERAIPAGAHALVEPAAQLSLAQALAADVSSLRKYMSASFHPRQRRFIFLSTFRPYRRCAKRFSTEPCSPPWGKGKGM